MSDCTPLLNHYSLKTKTVSVHGPVVAGEILANYHRERKGNFLSSWKIKERLFLRSMKTIKLLERA